MSRFFATGTDSEPESSSDEEPISRQPVATFTFSDDEEDTKRVVRSAKEKRYEELTNNIKQIRNHKKIKDMSSMLTSFEELQKAYTKAIPVIQKEENGATPRFYLRCLVELEDFINEMWEDRAGRKNMSKNNSKSLTSLRQKLRKYNKDFESDLAKFRENPDLADEDEEQPKEPEEDSEDELPGPQTFKRGPSEGSGTESKSTKPGADDDEGSDDSIDWGTSSDSSSESSDDEEQYQSIRERFLKRPTDRDQDEKREKKKERVKEPRLHTLKQHTHTNQEAAPLHFQAFAAPLR